MDKSKSGLPPGVRTRGDAIEINFMWRGQRHFVTWPIAPTPQNIDAAGRVRAQVAQRSRLGILSDADLLTFFPGAFPELEKATGVRQFGPLAQKWLDTVQVRASTREEYRKTLQRYWIPEFADRDIGEIRYSELLEAVKEIEWTSAKTRNNSLIPLRGVFELARLDQVIESNPTELLKNEAHDTEPPDPFTAEETELILADLRERHQGAEQAYLFYFELAFFTGLRTGELLALTWSDIDLRRGVIRIKNAMSRGKLAGKTKTSRSRDVLLNERAAATIVQLKALTYLEHGSVFKSPRVDSPWLTGKGPRTVFHASLKRLGIRRRPAYNTRHTYATTMLMAGVNLAFCADQLGHSIAMLLKHYARWLRSDADKSEMDKITGALNAKCGKSVAKG